MQSAITSAQENDVITVFDGNYSAFLHWGYTCKPLQ